MSIVHSDVDLPMNAPARLLKRICGTPSGESGAKRLVLLLSMEVLKTFLCLGQHRSPIWGTGINQGSTFRSFSFCVQYKGQFVDLKEVPRQEPPK